MQKIIILRYDDGTFVAKTDSDTNISIDVVDFEAQLSHSNIPVSNNKEEYNSSLLSVKEFNND